MPEPLELKIDDRELSRLLNRLQSRVDDLSPAMKAIGQALRTSIMKNFEEGGRYSSAGSIKGGAKKWDALSASTLAQKKGSKTLIKESLLMGSIHYNADRDSVSVGPDNIKYALIHQFGGMAGRGRSVKIPARPYVVVQDEDVTEIKHILNDHIASAGR